MPATKVTFSLAERVTIKRIGLNREHRNCRPRHVDLHLHSWFSDGFFSPADLALAARYIGLKVVAIGDHETNAGIAEMKRACKPHGIKVIPAVELTTYENDVDVHGYFMNFRCPSLLTRMREARGAKAQNIHTYLRHLRKAGIDITQEEIRATFPSGLRSKQQLAGVLLKRREADSFLAAMLRLNSLGSAYGWAEYVPPIKLPIREALELIHADGGIPIWTEPGKDRFERTFERSLKESWWGPNGLMGFEALHGRTDFSQCARIVLTISTGLRQTGINPLTTVGSDFHDGRRKGEVFGLVDSPQALSLAGSIMPSLEAAREDKNVILTGS